MTERIAIETLTLNEISDLSTGIVPDALLCWEGKPQQLMNYDFAIKEINKLIAQIGETINETWAIEVIDVFEQDIDSLIINVYRQQGYKDDYDRWRKQFISTKELSARYGKRGDARCAVLAKFLNMMKHDVEQKQRIPVENAEAIKMPSRYQKAVSELESIKTENLTSTNFKAIRHKARNVIDIYGDDEFQSRFEGMVKFRVHDHKSDLEKQKIIMGAIDSAIHFFRVKDESSTKQGEESKQTRQMETSRLKNASTEFNYKIWFYILLYLWLSTLNFGVPYMLRSMNWKYIIGIELAIVISVIVFYIRNVPGWVQFLIATVLAIAAIFFT